MSEAEVQRHCLNQLLASGWAVIRLNGMKARTANGGMVSSYTCYPCAITAGAPDLIAIRKNRTVFVEVKAGTGKQSLDQIRFEAWAKHFGIEYRVVYSPLELDDLTITDNEEEDA